MNKLDLKIIQELQKDSRISYNELSRITKKPSSTVHDHVKKLISKGIIRGYTIKVDERLIGLDHKALLGIETGAKLYKKVAQELCNMDEVSDVFSTTAEFDLMIKIKVSTQSDLVKSLNRIRMIEGIDDIFVISLLDVFKEDGIILDESWMLNSFESPHQFKVPLSDSLVG